MSDSSFDHAARGDDDIDSGTVWEPRARTQPLPTQTEIVDWHRLTDWLPRLGSVLWLYRDADDRMFPRARLLPHGVLLFDHPDLSALADCATVSAHSAITAHGPRAWLNFYNVHGVCGARLYLLPDADYLAWDAMLEECTIERRKQFPPARWQAHFAFMRCALARLRTGWRARVVRFPVLRLPCLHVLGLRAPLALSDLGRQLASAIATDECAALRDIGA